MKKQFAALAAAALLTAAGCSQDSNAHSGMGMGMGMGNTSETTAAAADLPKGVAQADVTFASR
jgi:membrane protease subunit (stomatin/prohibitin family)